MRKENTEFKTQMLNLHQMKLVEKFYLHLPKDYNYDVYGKILDGYKERYDVDEEELFEEFKDEDGEQDINYFLDDYLSGLFSYLRFKDEITTICLGNVLHPFVETMIVRFIIARYYGLHVQFEDEYLNFRDNLSDEDLNEFYSRLTSHGIKVDGHTLAGVEFD